MENPIVKLAIKNALNNNNVGLATLIEEDPEFYLEHVAIKDKWTTFTIKRDKWINAIMDIIVNSEKSQEEYLIQMVNLLNIRKQIHTYYFKETGFGNFITEQEKKKRDFYFSDFTKFPVVRKSFLVNLARHTKILEWKWWDIEFDILEELQRKVMVPLLDKFNKIQQHLLPHSKFSEEYPNEYPFRTFFDCIQIYKCIVKSKRMDCDIWIRTYEDELKCPVQINHDI
jgi:hypothetical protein